MGIFLDRVVVASAAGGLSATTVGGFSSTYPLPPVNVGVAGTSTYVVGSSTPYYEAKNGESLVDVDSGTIQHQLSHLQVSFQQQIAILGAALSASTNLDHNAINSDIQSDLPMYSENP